MVNHLPSIVSLHDDSCTPLPAILQFCICVPSKLSSECYPGANLSFDIILVVFNLVFLAEANKLGMGISLTFLLSHMGLGVSVLFTFLIEAHSMHRLLIHCF